MDNRLFSIEDLKRFTSTEEDWKIKHKEHGQHQTITYRCCPCGCFFLVEVKDEK